MFGGVLQPTHLILILVIVLIVFGPGKLPEIGGSLGKSLSEFKRSMSGGSQEDPSGTTATTELQSPARANLCPSCQTENPNGNQFCGKCGAKLA